ncbi:hypothetical protein INR49_018287 [Caranx melampygus]|nr:hypothetical protein INR49_018287 [Caranx melampygus]
MIMNSMRLTLMVLMLITLVVFSLWTRKKKTLSSNPEPKEAVEMMEVDSGPVYEDVTTAAQTEDREEQEDLTIIALLSCQTRADPDLQVLVERSSDQVELKCHSSFEARPSFVWYKNELKMEEETFSIRVSDNDDNRYSCALKGCEDQRSPPVCEFTPQCH